MFPIKKILAPIAVDNPEHNSLDYAIRLATQLGASVCALHVCPIPVLGFPDAAIIAPADTATRFMDTAQKLLDGAVRSRRDRGVELSSLLVTGNPWEEIVTVARRENADLIVMGTHGRRGVSRALLGSVAEQVLRTSTVPVLVIHGP